MKAIKESSAGAGASAKLRILHIAESYPPQYGGGAAIYVRDVCQVIAGQGHEVRVLSTEVSGRTPYALRSENDGAIQVNRLNLPYLKGQDPDGWTLGLLNWLQHQRRVVRILNDLIKEWRPDLVHYHATRPLGEECLVALHRCHIPVVAMLHEAWLICLRSMLLRSPVSEPCTGPGLGKCLECMYSQYDGTHIQGAIKMPWRVCKLNVYFAYRLWRRWIARKGLVGAIGYSQFITQIHKAHVPGLVRYLPLGINLDGLPQLRPVRPRMPFRFGFIGGFQENKGLHHILQASMGLRRAGLDFEVHVWGPGQEKGRAAIVASGLSENVVLRGMYEPVDLWTAYSEMDLALMATTVSEPFGRVVKEAAAAGIPTVAPAVGGITEQIRPDVDGLLFQFRNPLDLEKQMRRVLEEPGLYDRLRTNLLPVVDTREAALAVEGFYYEVLEGTTPPKVHDGAAGTLDGGWA